MRRATLAMIVLFSVLALIIIAILVYSFLSFTRHTESGSIGIIGGADGPTQVYTADASELLLDETISADAVREIDAEFGSDSVTLSPSEDGHIRVVQHGVNLPPERTLVVEQRGSTLHIRPGKSAPGIGFHPDSRSIVEIYLPESYGESLELDLASGELRVQMDLDLREFSVELSSGSFHADGAIRASQADLSVASGDLRLGALDAAEYELETASGNIEIGALTGSGEIELASGEVRLGGVTISQYMQLEVQSGTVDIALADDPAFVFACKTSSGNVDTYFDTEKTENGRELHATVGSAPHKRLDVKLTSGTVRIGRA